MKKKLITLCFSSFFMVNVSYADSCFNMQGKTYCPSQTSSENCITMNKNTYCPMSFVSANKKEDETKSKSTEKVASTSDVKKEVSNDAKVLDVTNKETPKVAEDKRDPSEIIEDQINAYIEKNNLQSSAMNDQGYQISTGIESIIVDVNDINFPQAKQIAFSKAQLSAQAQFVMNNWSTTIVNQISQLYNNNSSDARNIEGEKDLPVSGTWAANYAKLKAYAGSKINAKLQEQGIDPDSIAKDPTISKELAKDSFYEKTITKAFGDLSGLFSVKTFYVEKNNKAAIGTILMFSPKVKNLVLQLKSGNVPSLRGEGGESIISFINKSLIELVNEFGIRLIYDEKGQPAIISYGQAGYRKESSSNFTNINKNAAIKIAENQARANIAIFVNGSINVDNSSTTGSKVLKTLELNQRTNFKTEKPEQTIINILAANNTLYARSNLKGIRVLKKWRLESSYNPKNYTQGVIVAWSFASYNTTQKLEGIESINASNNISDVKNNIASVKSSENNKYLHQF